MARIVAGDRGQRHENAVRQRVDAPRRRSRTPAAPLPITVGMSERANRPRASLPPLDGCPLFAGLPPEALDVIERSGTRSDHAAGDVVLRQGEPATHLFVLLAGGARVLISGANGEEVTVKLFVAPAVFGEMEVITRTSWIESVEIVRRAHVVRFERAAVDEILKAYPVVCRRLLEDVCAR